MGAWARKVLLFAVLSVVGRRTLAQDQIIGNNRPCEQPANDPDPNNPTDNLSCPNTNPNILQCYRQDQLCDGTQDCPGGSDESVNLVALECSDQRFACSPGVFVPLTALCNGTDECVGGDDETTTICESG